MYSSSGDGADGASPLIADRYPEIHNLRSDLSGVMLGNQDKRLSELVHSINIASAALESKPFLSSNTAPPGTKQQRCHGQQQDQTLRIWIEKWLISDAPSSEAIFATRSFPMVLSKSRLETWAASETSHAKCGRWSNTISRSSPCPPPGLNRLHIRQCAGGISGREDMNELAPSIDMTLH